MEAHVRRFYDAHTGYEWERMERHRTEFAVTLHALAEHLPPAPARVLDCGGGPGRYAIEMARRGYAVTLFDLSPELLAFAREKAAEAGVAFDAVEEGTALDLSRFPDAAFDAVLLMGPLYHLFEESERRAALLEATRVLKPGGVLFAAFISRFAAHRDCAARYPGRLLEDREAYTRILDTGTFPPEVEGGWTAYFAHPEEISPLCRSAGLDLEALLGVEGLVSGHETAINLTTGEAWAEWVKISARVAPEMTLTGASDHLLAIARKPRWRTVLRELVLRLEAAGIPYRVVGGTAVTLHGLPLPVKDIDLETTAAGAYQIEALLEPYITRPVAFSESAVYRSHFGQFAIDGVTLEVMGDLERREGEGWAPTTNATETTVWLDGVPVRVPWLEEETLAYIRRGRLDRAALCLQHCDHARLMALLRGEVATGVLPRGARVSR